MASAKDIFEANIWEANIFASGIWRGIGGPPDKGGWGFVLKNNRSHFILDDNKGHLVLPDNRSHYDSENPQ